MAECASELRANTSCHIYLIPPLRLSFSSASTTTQHTHAHTMALRSSLTEYFVYTRFVLTKRSMVAIGGGGGGGSDEGEGYELGEWAAGAKAKAKRRGGDGRRGAVAEGRSKD